MNFEILKEHSRYYNLVTAISTTGPFHKPHVDVMLKKAYSVR